jgi:regulatory protein
MRTVTDIKPQRRSRNRANIFLNGSFAFSVGKTVIEERGIYPGQELTDSQIAELADGDSLDRCREAALRLLNYRPRSQSELRARLTRRFTKETVGEVILQLEAKHLIDDAAFATFWRDNRESLNPRSKRLIRLELSRKGVAPEVIAEVLENVDDEESAYRVAQKKERTLPNDDYEAFKRNLAPSLRRRGFGFETTNRAIKRLWEESHQSS